VVNRNIPITAQPSITQMPSLANQAAVFIKFMDPLSQTGDLSMNVSFSFLMRCFVWDCMYGCSGFDYESEAEATEAFLTHDCVCSRIDESAGVDGQVLPIIHQPHGVSEVPC